MLYMNYDITHVAWVGYSVMGRTLGHGGMGIPFSAIADGDQCINR